MFKKVSNLEKNSFSESRFFSTTHEPSKLLVKVGYQYMPFGQKERGLVGTDEGETCFGSG